MEEEKLTSAYKTHAVLDETDKDDETNVTYPSLSSVKEAKDWVESNSK